MQGFVGCLLSYRLTITFELQSLRDISVRRCHGQEDEPDRLLRRSATGSRDTRVGNTDIRSERTADAGRHLGCRLRRHGAVRLQRLLRHPELSALDVVRVRDHSPDVHVTRSGERRQLGADEAAGARLGARQLPPALAAEVDDRLRGPSRPHYVAMVRTPWAVTITTDGCCGRSAWRPLRRAERL